MTQSDYQQLRSLLAKRPFLVVTLKGDAGLVSEAEALRRQLKAGPFPQELILDVRRALESFANLAGVGKADRTFNLHEIARIVGINYGHAHQWMTKGAVEPSIRKSTGSGQGPKCEAIFSWGDAFVAGVVGVVRRNGIPPRHLKKVRQLFDGSTQKRTSAKLATSRRS